MQEDEALYPLEFIVQGVPASLQGSPASKAKWKEYVEESARRRQQETYPLGFLYEQPLAATIFYFPTAQMDGDIDNIVKPILDALIHVAYQDDGCIERVVVQKFEPDLEWNFRDETEQLSAALDLGAPVVYIRIDDDLSWRTPS